ncbi:hypothetical protein [Terrihabitans rhizophilus]|uniref:Lipoprotein n=1 Tax=Terrihabitans rhizophilus TaxID=3092662 RepID=A0ABU4RQL7_9HYPH|nr:hypothetical protein [Terrihabitans sp. PJ23]MDX6807143.1 hypothetical protein [Terrihabitans sp. PJ23]
MIGAVAVLGTAACAQKPETIQASYISDVGYQSWRCDQLAGEAPRIEAALAQASAQQNQTRSNDTAGVIFLGLPVSSMSGGNVAPEIARLKGEKEAIRRAMTLKDCGRAAPASSAPSRRPS